MSTITQNRTAPDAPTVAESDLPEGWSYTSILDLCDLVRGVSYKRGEESNEEQKGYIPLLRANNIDGEIVFEDLRYVSSSHVSEGQKLRVGDVVIAMSSGSKAVVGKAATLKQSWAGAFGAFCGVLRPSNLLDWRYFGYFFHARKYRDEISELSAGVNINNLKREYFERIPFPLAPAEEQNRVAEKIDSLFTQVNAARNRLTKVPKILKRFRQSVLTAACSGRLTEDWRENHPETEHAKMLQERIARERCQQWENHRLAKIAAKGRPQKLDGRQRTYKEPPEPEELDELPETWTAASLGQLYEIKYGLSEPLKKTAPDDPLDLPIISMAHINEYGSLILKEVKYFPISESRREVLLLRKGDLLFNWRNSPKWIGKTAIFNLDGKYVNASFLLRMRPIIVQDDGRFAWLFLNHLRMKGFFDFSSRAAVNQSNFNASEVSRMTIPLPPLQEQHEIVRRVEVLFKLADMIEKRVEGATKRAERLTQAILAKAFRGELVPTEAELARREGRPYEPASVLLERIRAEREKSATDKSDGKHPRRRGGKR